MRVYMPLHCSYFLSFSKCSHFSNISCFLEPFFAQNNLNVFLDTFQACFRQFQSQTLSILYGLWPLHCGHFWAFSKSFHFSNISCFYQPFFAQNNFNVFVESFFACLRHFYFLTKLSILHGLQPLHCGHFWAFSKSFHILNSSCFFQPFFAQNNSNVFEETSLVYLRQFYFWTQTEYFAWAIAFALWPLLAIFKLRSFFEYQLFFEAVSCIEEI